MPAWILIGAALGVVAGVVFGERIAILEPIGSAYSMLLQIAIYPYLLCSLLSGLGKLTPPMAMRLLKASWGAYLFMWGLTLGSIWLIARAIPTPPPPSVLTPEMLRSHADLLNLLIPANLVTDFYRNYVPAIVIFAILYGIAVQRAESKASLFDALNAMQVASVTIWQWIVRLAPIGVFALIGSAAGTIQPDRLAGLLLYVGLFMAATMLLAFVVLPAVLAAIAPVSYRELLTELRPAFVLALVTTLSVAALPFVMRAAERIVARAGCPEGEERKNVLQASLSLSYVLAQLGNYFIYLLMLYAAWFFHVRIGPTEQVLLPMWTVLSGFGSPTATLDGVVFLGTWLHMPHDIVDLYLETWTVTRYGQVALSVMGFGFATIAVPLVYFRKVQVRRTKLAAVLAGSAAVLATVAIAGVSMRGLLLEPPSNRPLAYTLDPELIQGVTFTVQRSDAPESGPAPTPTLSAIRARGVLRVGYSPIIIPFSYWNSRNELVGFDIAYAFRLARDLGVQLEFIPFAWQRLGTDLENNRFDIAMAGIYVTDERLQNLTVSRFYYHSPVALIVPSSRATAFMDRAAINAMKDLRLVSFDDPVLLPTVRRLFPNAKVEVVPDYDVLPQIADRFDAAIWSEQQANTWSAAHPGFTATVPTGTGAPFMFAYLLPPNARSFQEYLDQWLILHADDGFRQEQVAYWLEGKPRASRQTRWNLLDAVLGNGTAQAEGRAPVSGAR
ncbi:MAG: cation:dicarboxylase symporter family transporter [Alphaproteobacteria bacterium]|nr:cation:dicarboxylase symporter family transporter [Alphaproteobacteria bacterium]